MNVRIRADAPGNSAFDWERIEGFLGFGRADAPVVFLGMEEGLRSPESLPDDLAIRSWYPNPVMDLAEAHRGIAGTERYFDPERAPRQPTWRVMADLMLRRAGRSAPTGTERRVYRATQLGRSDGETLLTEILPYPHPKASDWLYAPFGRFATRSAYERNVLPMRRRLLRDVITSTARDLIVCYGKAHWAEYERLFGEVTWSERDGCRTGFQ